MLIGVDYHPSFEQIAFLVEETGEYGGRQLNHSTTRSLRSLPSEIAMHRVAATDSYPSPARRGATAHATTGHAGGDAAATSHRGTSIRQFEIPHLRTSTLPAAWTAGSANGNQSGRSCLQSEAHAEHSRRTQATCSPAGHLILLPPALHDDNVNSPPPKPKKRCTGTRNIPLISLSPSFRNSLKRGALLYCVGLLDMCF